MLSVLKPMDVYPCVTDEGSWTSGSMVEDLFGDVCSSTNFLYDQETRRNGKIEAAAPLESMPSQTSIQANRRPPSGQEDDAQEAGYSHAGGYSALERPQTTCADLAEVTLGSTTPAKRHAGIRTSPRKRAQEDLTRQASCAVNDDHALDGSFSGWLNTANHDPMHARHEKCKTAAEVDNEVLGKAYAPISTECASASMHPNSSLITGAEPRGATCSAQSEPVELSDTSGSETEDGFEEGAPTKGNALEGEVTGQGSQNETWLSATDSIFESREPGSAAKVSSTSDSSLGRIQRRREAYERVQKDDGHAWGRDFGLLSTATRDDDDDSEEL
ncbi:MAG: hypothetical protein L6R39_002993 [Caloplaca ligustica]|nr:MAG: hypothetical protein L6R39_002993 [Caloplaca ligustica]